MGADYYYCTECKECLHSQCFGCCAICFDTEYTICRFCIKKNTLLFEDLYICDHCIENFTENTKETDYFFNNNPEVKTKKNKKEFIKHIKALQTQLNSP